MKILHYSLGFPPYRTGGLTKFCVDLMRQQIKEGYDVSLLWPGKIEFFSSRTKIQNHRSIDGIRNFEIINPNPVSYDEGIKDFEIFKQFGDLDVYDQFLKFNSPNIIHVHTLMGLHMSFLKIAKKYNIRLIFTTHDFFSICPKVTLFRRGRICNCAETCNDCGICNNSALSMIKIQMLQSPIYRKLKDCKFVKLFRNKHRENFLNDELKKFYKVSVGSPKEYKSLRYYYQSMLSMMDIVHYNSTITKNVYESFFKFPYSKVINITHSDIGDHRSIKKFSDQQLRIRYLGSPSGYKGFYLLKVALDKLWKEKQNFCLDIHFKPQVPSPYMRVHERYSYSELKTIFEDTDVLVVPSIWYETFGFTVLEALSYGVPVIISSTVGARDILVDGGGLIIDEISSDKIYNVIKLLSSEDLIRMNKKICLSQKIKTLEFMSHEIMQFCYMESYDGNI